MLPAQAGKPESCSLKFQLEVRRRSGQLEKFRKAVTRTRRSGGASLSPSHESETPARQAGCQPTQGTGGSLNRQWSLQSFR